MANNNGKMTMAQMEARVDAFHSALSAGAAAREDCMAFIVERVEAGSFDVSSERGAENKEFNHLFARFRDGKGATKTSDLSLKSRFLKVGAAAQALRNSERKFSHVMADVKKKHEAMTRAAKAEKDEKARAKLYPRQLLEAFYEAGKAQLSSEKPDVAIGGNVIATVTAKPVPVEISDDEQLKKVAADLVKALDKFIGAKPADYAKAVPGATKATLRAAREALNGLAGPQSETIDPNNLTADQLAEMLKAAKAREKANAGK